MTIKKSSGIIAVMGFLRAAVLAVVVAGGGCGGLQFGDNHNVASLDNPAVAFKIRGFIIIKPKNKTIRRLSFVWRRLADSSGKAEDTITVRNAAGIAQAQVRADSNSAQLITPQKTTRAQTAESLTARAFGMPLPLQVLGDFLGGDNDAVRIFREKMRQLGWRVRFAADDADGLPLRFGADGDRGSIDIAITGRQ